MDVNFPEMLKYVISQDQDIQYIANRIHVKKKFQRQTYGCETANNKNEGNIFKVRKILSVKE